MDGRILAQRAHPPTEQEAAHAALLDAARDALAWLKHAPQEAIFGGEERLTRHLSAEVRMSSFEVRECLDCYGGTVPVPTASPMERPTPAPCPACEGRGTVRVFAYPGPKGRRGR